MKRLFIFALASLVACTKTNTSPSTSLIAGQWELRELIGGIAGDVRYASGNGNIIEFGTDSKFKVFETLAITSASGTYRLSGDTSSHNLIVRLSYDSGFSSLIMKSAKIENSKMTFSYPQGCCDMPDTVIYGKLP